MKLVRECEEELDRVGIKYRTVRSWSVNTRAKCRWGQCKKLADGTFEINISERLLCDSADDISVKSTIIHELLHTIDGGFKHTGKWREAALKVNSVYPQYNIKRTDTAEEKGFGSALKPYQKNYKILCIKCGYCFYRQKASKVVTHPNRYRCGKCGGRLAVIKIKENTERT